MTTVSDHPMVQEASVVLVKGNEEQVVYRGGWRDCEAWLALNGDKPSSGEGHFEIREELLAAERRQGG